MKLAEHIKIGKLYYRKFAGRGYQLVKVNSFTKKNYPKVEVYYKSLNEWKELLAPYKKELYEESYIYIPDV
tara:strand:+ start:1638 stop:1850 length:213 start_codon:yes stop_codon:yes gene_type:complete